MMFTQGLILTVMLVAGCGSTRTEVVAPSERHESPVADPPDEQAADPQDEQAPKPERAPTPPDGVRSVTIENGIKVGLTNKHPYCYTSELGALCAGDLEMCQSAATKLGSDKPCWMTGAMACFLAKHVMTGTSDAYCFGEMAACLTIRNSFYIDAEFSGVGECFVVRYSP